MYKLKPIGLVQCMHHHSFNNAKVSVNILSFDIARNKSLEKEKGHGIHQKLEN